MKAILTYHSIDDSGSVISTDRDTFRQHIDWLCTAKVPVHPLSHLVEPECREGIALTFDAGWVDVHRTLVGEQEGPYTWWSMRGKAFDNDAGWRIDYQLATPSLASAATDVTVDRAAAWDERWSDHAPLTVEYALD